MYCESIVTHVKHEVRGKIRKDSFFVLICDARDHFTLKILGECFVDEHSMWNYIAWVDGGIKELALLVSLDYKYAMLRHVNEAREIDLQPGEQLLPLLPHLRNEPNWADKAQGIYGPPREKLIPMIEREIGPYADLCRIYGFRPNLENVPDILRVNLEDRVFDFGLSTVDNGILEGLKDPKFATDDALFWLYMLKGFKNPRLKELNHNHVMAEIRERIETGYQVQPMFYSTVSMSIAEMQMRTKRAKKLLQRVSQVIKQDFGFQDVQAILKEVTNDEALELYVVGFWGSGEQDQLEWYIANELNSRALENRPL